MQRAEIGNQVQNGFSINKPLAYMQSGLSAYSNFSDYIYVTEKNFEKLNEQKLQSLIHSVISLSQKQDDIIQKNNQITMEQIPTQRIIFAIDTQTWKKVKKQKNSSFQIYKPWQRSQNAKKLPESSKNFYKFNIKILIQVKKLKRDQGKGKFRKRNKVTLDVLQVLESLSLGYQVIQGQSRQFCGVKNAIIAGYFNDNVEKPKDPYTFFLNCLIGYQRPSELGGSYLLAQKCLLKWNDIHQNIKKIPGVIGRNQIKTNSSIFSQLHCPFSHIRVSRIKDNYGNPVTLFRQSKSFTTDNFKQTQYQSQSDYIRPEQGIFFMGYHKDHQILQKMLESQLGTLDNKFNDQLLNYFNVTDGNILYVPSKLEMLKFLLQYQKKNQKKIQKKQQSQSQTPLKDIFNKVIKQSTRGLAQICRYHTTRWLHTYHKHKMQEKKRETTCNNYYLYSRAQFMKKMSYAQTDQPELDPPSPRIMRLLAKTFALWQDTWYFDRRQKQFENLQYFIQKYPQQIKYLKKQSGYEGNISHQFQQYKKIPIVIRNGLAIYFNLGHVVSTEQYGCRGPVNRDPNQVFGANTFHLEPEDLLAGGQANLTFGQGKHLIQYFTEDQLKQNWMLGLNLSAHSGIGHVNPYMEYIIENGLKKLTQQFKRKANQFKNKDIEKQNLFIGSIFSLLGMKRYFQNYAELALRKSQETPSSQVASKKSFKKIHQIMKKLSTSAPSDIQQGAQLVLSVFICLHLTGQPVSLGRLDHSLRKFANKVEIGKKQLIYDPPQSQQDIIDCFWIKVGEKANFNKTFFEDHQKFGNLAFGGNSVAYPQGASFNQWGHQITVGGTQCIYDPKKKDYKYIPFYNSVTISCLRASRRIPVNAPCLGLRVRSNTPQILFQQAAKAILAGGAHPIILNDQKIIEGFIKSGDYKIDKKKWDEVTVKINDKQTKDVPYNYWDPRMKMEDACNFGSDGCYQFLPIGKSWFWLGGGNVLQPLQYVINVGKSLLHSGPRFIHGKRQTYRWKELKLYQTYEQFEKEYFSVFQQVFSRGFFFQLSNFENLTKYCPATLLNAFTQDMIKRESDFYTNGANYKLFCPQFTGVANLVNSLWNIKELVFNKGLVTLEQARNALLVNWGDELQEPFVSKTLPVNNIEEMSEKIKQLRKNVWNQKKFGIDRNVTIFGLRIMKQMSRISRRIFQQPNDQMLRLLKTLTGKYGSQNAPFGFQYLPGCGTFQSYADFGADIGASFDGRKKAQPIAEDLTSQNFLFDVQLNNEQYKWNSSYLEDLIKNYNFYDDQNPNNKIYDPEFFSGAVLDLNIQEDYDMATLKYNISQFAKGAGPNLITVTTANRPMMQELRYNMDRDLMRFRQGGWSQFGISMFPHLLQHHIRRKRSIAKPVLQTPSKNR